jgi:hypothetical protein
LTTPPLARGAFGECPPPIRGARRLFGEQALPVRRRRAAKVATVREAENLDRAAAAETERRWRAQLGEPSRHRAPPPEQFRDDSALEENLRSATCDLRSAQEEVAQLKMTFVERSTRRRLRRDKRGQHSASGLALVARPVRAKKAKENAAAHSIARRGVCSSGRAASMCQQPSLRAQ